MSEKEIRLILQKVCAELDQQGRRVMRKVVYPSILGAGLALTACDDRDVPNTTPDAKADVAPGADAAYMGPAPDGRMDMVPGLDSVYMAPDGGPMPPYMAPDDGGGILYMAPDGGPMPPYMAPDSGPVPPGIEAGVQPDYMGPDPDGGGGMLYMAPGPDSGK